MSGSSIGGGGNGIQGPNGVNGAGGVKGGGNTRGKDEAPGTSFESLFNSLVEAPAGEPAAQGVADTDTGKTRDKSAPDPAEPGAMPPGLMEQLQALQRAQAAAAAQGKGAARPGAEGTDGVSALGGVAGVAGVGAANASDATPAAAAAGAISAEGGLRMRLYDNHGINARLIDSAPQPGAQAANDSDAGTPDPLDAAGRRSVRGAVGEAGATGRPGPGNGTPRASAAVAENNFDAVSGAAADAARAARPAEAGAADRPAVAEDRANAANARNATVHEVQSQWRADARAGDPAVAAPGELGAALRAALQDVRDSQAAQRSALRDAEADSGLAVTDVRAGGDDRRDAASLAALTPATLATPATSATIATPAAETPRVMSLAAHPATPAWRSEFIEGVRVLANEGAQRAELRLHPADIGPVNVTINLAGDQGSIAFMAANEETRKAIEAALPQLRELLADSGITLGNTTVGQGSGQSSWPSGQPGQSGQSNPASAAALRAERNQRDSANASDALANAAPRARVAGNHVIDTYA